ncbi:MAG: 50S ribosome-binding GTPase [Clostridiales bacterium]|jgi:tRNA U34 5-carboxymethylaminomethyl modifying GTPase MnmE/TrmE|nr:50S ribosome-binding GTPase [Clostridiales bacterium]
MKKIIAALSTPNGKGGIGIIRMSGEGCLKIAEEIFKSKSKRLKHAVMNFGKIDADGIRDDCYAVFFESPRSFTGEDTVEFHCHGGEALTDGILKALYRRGAFPAARGEFSKRAFLNGKLSLSDAEGIVEVINAENTAAVKAAYRLMSGETSREIYEVQGALLSIIAGLEAALDYPDEIDIFGENDGLRENFISFDKANAQEEKNAIQDGSIPRKNAALSDSIPQENKNAAAVPNGFMPYEKANAQEEKNAIQDGSIPRKNTPQNASIPQENAAKTDSFPYGNKNLPAALDALISRLDALLLSAKKTNAVKRGINIAVIGKPNTGKSSLLNRFTGKDRAIVTDIAGTTRDTLEECFEYDGMRLNITDTAGLRNQTEDIIEQKGIERSIAAAKGADVVLYVIDAERYAAAMPALNSEYDNDLNLLKNAGEFTTARSENGKHTNRSKIPEKSGEFTTAQNENGENAENLNLLENAGFAIPRNENGGGLNPLKNTAEFTTAKNKNNEYTEKLNSLTDSEIIIVLNKADKIKDGKTAYKNINAVCEKVENRFKGKEVSAVSALTNGGIDPLSDITKNAENRFKGKEVFAVSALTGEGIDPLLNAVVSRFKGTETGGAEISVNMRHAALAAAALADIKSARQSVNAVECALVDLKNAFNTLGEITGQTASEDVINAIFEKFCLGK